MRLDSALKKVVPNISRPKKSRHFLMKLPDNFQMSEHSWPCRFHIKFKNIKQANKMTFITHGFRDSVVSDVRERIRDLRSPLHFMLRRSSLVECVSVLHGTCLQCAEIIFIHQYVQPCLSKNPKYTFYTIKSSLTLAY